MRMSKQRFLGRYDEFVYLPNDHPTPQFLIGHWEIEIFYGDMKIN